MGGYRSLGACRAAELRDDRAGLDAVATVTGLPVALVAERLRAAHGSKKVWSILRDQWPWTASALASRTVAHAREYGLNVEIQRVTRASRILVSRRINAAHGKQLLKNLFWDWWPEADVPPPEPDMEPVEAAPDEDLAAVQPMRTSFASVGPGDLLCGRYEIRRELGRGGFGVSWIAHDRLSELEVVLKIPRTDDGGAIRNELRCAFRLVHPNVCQAFPERDDETGQPFLVMQYGGDDLGRRLAAGERPTLAMAVHVLVSVADALDYLHQQQVLHLDVSPGNVLLDDDDVVRLTDFGASARVRAEMAAGGLTQVATSLHSFHPCYAAPELYDGKGRSRSDQYSLFRVFCSLLEARVHTSPHYEFRPFAELSSAQNDIVSRALEHDPDQRFESCSEPARALADDMAAVPQRVLAADLGRLVEHLVRRVELEQRRITSGTVRLGAAVKIGRGLERVLQGTLLWMSAIAGFDALAAVRQRDPHASTLDRTTAGTIAKTIMHQGNEHTVTAQRAEIALIVGDLGSGGESRLWGLINARNDVLHGRRGPERILPAAEAAAELLRSQLAGLHSASAS